MALLTGDNTAAVASGLQRTGGLITSLALVLLVPATMRLLGWANWWAPRPLRRLYARYGILIRPGGRRCARWPWPQPARAFRLGTVATAARDRGAAASPHEE